MSRIAAAALICSFAAPQPARGEMAIDPTQTFLPSECVEEDGCLCLLPPGIEIVTQRMIDADRCEAREREMAPAVDALKQQEERPAPWWAEPQVVVGGLALSFGIGLGVAALLSVPR